MAAADDLFGDLPGITIVKESSKPLEVEKVSAALNSPFAGSEPFRTISQTFPKPFQPRAEADLTERIEFEKKIYAKLQELHAVRERLYQIRFDPSRDPESVKRDVQNHIQELSRLELGLTKIRQASLRRYTESLDLSGIGIRSQDLLNSSVMGRTAAPPPPSTMVPSSLPTGTSASDHAVEFEESDEEGAEPAPLMRTKSTQTLRDKAPSEKWAGLFRMFREWKHQHQVAEATHIVGRKDTILDSEIAKLRAAVYTLKQKKELSEGDRQLLVILQKKLEVCNNLYMSPNAPGR